MSSTHGQAPDSATVSGAPVLALAEAWVGRQYDWSAGQQKAAATVAARLIEDIPEGDVVTIGLSGAPGTGKSALAHTIAAVLNQVGRNALVVSLDNYYLGKLARHELAKIHPLFAQRGIPGTPDWPALINDIDRIRAGDLKGLRLPVFDKSRDDRAKQDAFHKLDKPPQVVILEGWLIGAPPQDAGTLTQAKNRLEKNHDPDGRWRKLANLKLGQYHLDLGGRLDQLWFLAAPDWDSVVEWRWQQERGRAGATGGASHLASREQVEVFLGQFQRIALHMLKTAVHWADRIVRIDRAHIMSLT